jgi:hypothetical protein
MGYWDMNQWLNEHFGRRRSEPCTTPDSCGAQTDLIRLPRPRWRARPEECRDRAPCRADRGGTVRISIAACVEALSRRATSLRLTAETWEVETVGKRVAELVIHIVVLLENCGSARPSGIAWWERVVLLVLVQPLRLCSGVEEGAPSHNHPGAGGLVTACGAAAAWFFLAVGDCASLGAVVSARPKAAKRAVSFRGRMGLPECMSESVAFK